MGPGRRTRARMRPPKAADEEMTSRMEIKGRLDNVVSKIVRFDIKSCPTCRRVVRRGTGFAHSDAASGWNLTNSHVMPKRVDATAFDIFPGGNCVPQCLRCNVNHTQMSSSTLRDWFKAKYGPDKLALVDRRWSQGEKNRPTLIELSDKLTLYLHILELLTAGKLRREELIVDYETGKVSVPGAIRGPGGKFGKRLVA